MKLFRGDSNGKPVYYRETGGDKEIVEIGFDERGALSILGFSRAPGVIYPLPCVNPSKIVCIGRNYAAHAEELGNRLPEYPLLFLKAPSAVIGVGTPIALPQQSKRVEHEGELAIVIGRAAKDIRDDEEIGGYVFGFSCLNDVTARDLQKADGQFARAKSFDSFCPVGPAIETSLDASDLALTVRVNGELRQNGRTSQMVFDIPYLLRYISRQMTLLPGDIVATGTPSGVSQLNPGDICEVEIEGIGALSNPVTN